MRTGIKLSKGQWSMIFATILFSFMNVLVKHLDRIPAVEIIFFRALVGLLFSGLLLYRFKISPRGKNLTMLLMRGFFGTVALLMFFYSLKHMPLASAVTIQYLSPLFAIFISSFILKEKSDNQVWVFTALAFIGAALIKGFDPRVSLFDLTISVSSAVFSALAYNLVRKLKDNDSPLVVIFYFPLVTLFIVASPTAQVWVLPVDYEWVYLLAIGLLVQGAQYFLTVSLQLERASRVTPLTYLGTPLALSYGLFFFGETLGLLSLAGVVLVLIGAIRASLAKEDQ